MHDAKEQVASFEGVWPCRQRLLLRGISMEPDSALLRTLGVRNGDTLILGYKLGLPEVTTHAAEEPEGSFRDVTVVAEAMETQNVVGGDRNDNEISAETAETAETAEVAADGDESSTPLARGDSAAAAAPADARASNDRVDVTGGGGGGEGGDSAPVLASGGAAGRGNEKTGRRRAWWSRKKSRSTRRRGDSSQQGHDGSEGERLAGAVVPSSTFSSDPINGTNARCVRVSPAPELPAHLNASAGSIARGVEPDNTDAVYDPAMAGLEVRQPPSPSMERTNLAGWARWGRRMPALPIFGDAGSGGSG